MQATPQHLDLRDRHSTRRRLLSGGDLLRQDPRVSRIEGYGTFMRSPGSGSMLIGACTQPKSFRAGLTHKVSA